MVLRSCIEGTQNYFLETAFWRVTNDKYLRGSYISHQTCRGLASAVTGIAYGFQLGCNSLNIPDPQKARHGPTIIVGTIQATLPLATCETFPKSVDLAWECWRWIKLSVKVDRTTALLPEKGCSKSRARRDVIGRTRSLLAVKAKSASPNITAVSSSDLNSKELKKHEFREAKSVKRD